MDVLTSIPLGDFSSAGLVALAVILLFRGDIAPRRHVEAIEKERDFWRAAAIEYHNQLAELTAVSRAATAALDALPTPPADEGPS